MQGVRILGRGVLDGSLWKQWETNLITINDSSDVEIRGIVVRDSPCWTVVPHRCERVTVSDVKILENLRIHGKLITSAEDGKIRINPHVRNVRFLATGPVKPTP